MRSPSAGLPAGLPFPRPPTYCPPLLVPGGPCLRARLCKSVALKQRTAVLPGGRLLRCPSGAPWLARSCPPASFTIPATQQNRTLLPSLSRVARYFQRRFMVEQRNLISLRARKGILLTILAVLNVLLLWQLPPLRWPYLWPTPLIYLLLGGVILILWLRERGYWSRMMSIRLAGLVLIFLSESYALHSLIIFWTHPTLTATLHAISVVWITAVLMLGIGNQFWRQDNRTAPPLPAELPEIAAVIPTYGEPVEILEPVVQSLVALDYPADRLRIYITDDGHRPEVEQLAARYHVVYHRGAKKDAKAGNLNSCLPLIHELQPGCDLVFTEDAD